MNVLNVSLGEVCGILSGFAWSAFKFNQDRRGVPIIRIQNVDAVLDNDFVYWDEPYDERFVIRKGDLLLTLSGSFRIESWGGPDALLNQRIIKLTPSPELDRGWLLHVLRPRLGQIERLGKHALVNNVSIGDIRNLGIPLPPLTEQRRIAKVLDSAEALRAKRRAGLAQLDPLVESLFLDLFGDPIRNPKGWSTLPFESQIDSVRYGTGSPPDYVDNGIPFIRATNIKGGTVQTKDLKRISATDAERLSKCQVSAGDLIVVRSGVNTGDCAVVPTELDGTYAAYDLIVRLNQISAVFYNFLINSLPGKAMLSRLTRRAAQAHLNADQLRQMEFIAPPMDLRKKFARRIKAVEKLKTAQRASLAEMDALFATLQHRAFKGEL